MGVICSLFHLCVKGFTVAGEVHPDGVPEETEPEPAVAVGC